MYKFVEQINYKSKLTFVIVVNYVDNNKYEMID